MPVLTEDALYFGVLKQGFVVLFFKLLLAAFRVARDTAAKSARLARGGVRGARLSLFGDSSLGISTSPLASCPSECTSWQLSLTTPVPQHSIADLQLVTSAVRWPRDDEVVVRVHAIGLNFTDVFTILGLYAETRAAMATAQDGFGLCPGLEFAGEVVRIGRNVSGLRPGDRVCGFTVGGAFRTVVTCREALLRPIPANWTYEHAAALLVHGVTAWHALVELGRATKKSRVLVHAAAGGVGSMAMRLCQSMGCQVVAVVGSARKAEELTARFHGAWTPEAIIVRGEEASYTTRLKEATLGTRGFDIALESLGSGYLSGALDALAPSGVLVAYGATALYGSLASSKSAVEAVSGFVAGLVSQTLSRLDSLDLARKNKSILGFNLLARLMADETELLAEVDTMLTKSGLLNKPPHVGRTFDFRSLPQALEYVASGDSTGKVVVSVMPS